ncbi:MAG: hypothetical protein V1810_01835 [Candidatus Beckwithbacteria bacterium]
MLLESLAETKINVTEPINFELGNYRFCNLNTPGGKLGIFDMRFGYKKNQWLMVTARYFSQYENKWLVPAGWGARLMSGCDQLQLISIGAGLDETLKYALVAKTPPIIIDPIEPGQIVAGLTQACRDYQLSNTEKKWALRRIRRAKTYESGKVIHYKMTFQQAMKDHWSDLTGKADIVMDLFGAWFYINWSGQTILSSDDLKAAYRQLLKPDGLGEIWASSSDHGPSVTLG